MARSRARFSILIAAALAALSLGAGGSPTPRVELKLGAHVFDVEVAATPTARARGLKGRTRLADNAGMLFVFREADQHCFWMKDTPIPLSIAFLADDGTIVGIDDMQPQTTTLQCAPEPVRFALEIRQGGFRERGIRPGVQASGGPFGP